MTENINWKMNVGDEYEQEEPSSRHLLFALEDLLQRSHTSPTFVSSKIKYQSKSLDDLFTHRRYRQNSINDDNKVSNTTQIELDLCGTGYDEENHAYDSPIQRSQSAPVLPTNIYDKELATSIRCDQQQSITDNFVYNIDLSDSNETSHELNSRLAVFFEDDYSSEDINYEPFVSLNHSSLINNCLTITEENEDELEQLRRDDDEEQQQNILLEINKTSTPTFVLLDDYHRTVLFDNDNQIESDNMNNLLLLNTDNYEDNFERLSTIYESPSPQAEIEEVIDDDNYDKLIVYDMANTDISTKLSMIHPIPESTVSTSLSHRSPITDRNSIGSCYTDVSFETYPNLTNTLSASRLCGTTTMIMPKVYNPLSLTTNHNQNSSSSPVINTDIIPSAKQHSPSRSSPMLFSTDTNGQSTIMMDNNKSTPSHYSSQHIKTMKVIQTSSSSLSDFISSPLQNITYRGEVPNVHHSLTDCSLINKTLSLIDDNDSIRNKIFDNNQRRPSHTRRILTNGLLFSHCASNPIPRRVQQARISTYDNHYSITPKSEDKLLSDTSSSSELLSSSDEKLLSRSDYILRQEQITSQQRKASSLKSISMISSQPVSKILYPIDFETDNMNISWHQKRLSDSGIAIDIQPKTKSSIEEDIINGVTNMNQLKQYESNYQKTLTDLLLIKKNIVDIETRFNEVMQELEIEQALIEGEHELVFKQILDASEIDQQKIRQLHKNLQLLIERLMTEKTSIRNEIDYTQQLLFQLEHEYEQQYRSSDEKILIKKDIIAMTRKKYEDLEFQLMELETRCESELEQAEEHFRNEQKFVTQTAKMRQNTLRELDHQQYMALHEAAVEKEKLEREKQKLKLLFKQKKLEANELEQKIHDTWSSGNNINRAIYQSTPLNLYNSLNYSNGISSPKMERNGDQREKLNDMMFKSKLEKVTNLEQQLRERYNENIKRIEFEHKQADEIQNHDYRVKLREKHRVQERPLTRYLPIRSADFDLRAHIEGAGHSLASSHISLTTTSCRGYLHKMGGMKFKTWNRRWFVFDRQRRSLSYYQDKNETKLRGCIYFQSILDVYIDQLQSLSLRSPEPREATFIVKTIQRSYYLVAPTVELMRIWIDVIITGAEGNTFANV